MNVSKKLLPVIFSAALAASFLGCSSDTISPVEDTSGASSELKTTYSMLYYYYYLADTELGELSTYVDNPLNVYINPAYADVADVITMFYAMSDKLTRYFPSAYYESLVQLLTESDVESKSFGMEVDSSLGVKYVYKEGPAVSAGIQKRDHILAVDGNQFETLSELDSYLESIENRDSFLFSLERDNLTYEVSMTRTKLNVPTVYVDTLSDVPIIRVTEFTNTTNGYDDEGTLREFKDALEATAGANSTILDLRGNGGGYVSICTQMAGELLSNNDTIIYERSWEPEHNRRSDNTTGYLASGDGIGKGRYYVLMLDSNSASCSEIFAAALTSNLKTPIVGTNSFGKGIGQLYLTTETKGICGITSVLFYDKDGYSYHTYGFVPDIYEPDSLEALNKAVELAKTGSYSRTEGYSSEMQPYWASPKTLGKKSTSIDPEEYMQDALRGLAIVDFK